MNASRLFRLRRLRFLVCNVILPALALTAMPALLTAADDAAPGQSRWYRGSTHLHSFWSDGDQFPDMAAAWYKEHGYQFLCPSDHNVLMQGDRWVRIRDRKRPIPMPVFVAYLRRFKQPWVETRGRGASQEVRLKTFHEIRKKLEEPGKFLMIQAEEITGECNKKQVHVNALNLAELIMPQQAPTVAETIRADLAAVAEQAKRLGRPILAQVNHPNWKDYDILPEELAEVTAARFFEVCNANADSSHYGDRTHPGTERMWDLVNTIRLADMKAPPIYGVAGDDTHHYHEFGPGKANPGRAWIMVRAAELSTGAILASMDRGDFYATTGVELAEYTYDAESGTLSVAVRPQPGARYTIEFIGTLSDFDRTARTKTARRRQPNPAHSPLRDNPEVGRVLHAVRSTSATYKLTGNELYVRAVVRSNLPTANPPGSDNEVKRQIAWCQPVGWQKWCR